MPHPEDFASLNQTELLTLLGDSYNPKDFDFEEEKVKDYFLYYSAGNRIKNMVNLRKLTKVILRKFTVILRKIILHFLRTNLAPFLF